MYLALYRKYRPQNFDEVIGQDHIIVTLRNQIKADKISHAYLFCGSRGTGKTSTAKIFARAINCEHPVNGSPCGKCAACKALSGNNIDILEIDAASNNGVDEIRDLREKIKYPPVNGRYKVYIVDEVHMLSPSAFNALLKTLEEPPSYAVFILATTEVHKLPATILSRCLRFDFGLVKVSELVELLRRVFKAEGVTAEDEALEAIARAGEGSVRDTLSVADRCVSFANGNLTFKNVMEVLGRAEKESLMKITDAVLRSDMGQVLKELDAILSEGKSPLVLSKDLISYFRDLLVISTLGDEGQKMVVASTETYEKMKAQVSGDVYGKLMSALTALSEVEAELRYSISPRLVLETALIKTIAEVNIERRVENIEKQLSGQTPVVLQKTAEKPAAKQENTQQNTQNDAQKPQKEVKNAGLDGSDLLANLLSYLREKKDMGLLGCIRQVLRVDIQGKSAIFVMEDKMTVDIIMRDKYRQVLKEFFDSIGYDYRFIVEENHDQERIDSLKGAFGDKFKVKE